MAGSGVTLYALTSAGNKAVIGAIDWREDIYMPSQINDNVAQIMADIRAMANAVATGWIEIGDGDGVYTATYVSATSFRFDGVNVTAYYRTGMRVRVVAPTPGTLSGTITSSAFSTHTTLVVAWDSGSLSNEAITSVSLGVGSGGGAGSQPSYRNILGRNGGMEVWQRGAGGSASFAVPASTPLYTADGWYFSTGAGQACVVSQQAGLNDSSRYCMRVQRNAGQTGVGVINLEYALDGDEIVPGRNSIVTLSMTLRAGANYAGSLGIGFHTGTGSPGRVTAGFPGLVSPVNTTQVITTTATRYSWTSTVVVPTNATQAGILLQWTPVGTAGAADYFEMDDVQIEVGSVATPFERRPFEQELAACRRHYFKTFPYEMAPAQNAGANNGDYQFIAGKAGLVTNYGFFPFAVPLRVAPTVTGYNPAAVNAQVFDGISGQSCSGTAFLSSARGTSLNCVGASGTLVGSLLIIHATADAGI